MEIIIRGGLPRSVRPLFLCFLISLFIICTYYVLYDMKSNEKNVQFTIMSTPPSAHKKKATKHKKTLEKVLARGGANRARLVKSECNCTSQTGENKLINASDTQDSKLQNRNIQCMKKQYPKALIVGMTKGGTTALGSFLNEHPQIVTRISRPFDTRYFNYYYDKPYDWYRNLMPCSFPHQITISRSTEYFFTASVPERIKKFDPSMKIIIIVREPIARAVSQYVMWKLQAEYRIGNISLEDAVTTGVNKDIDPSSRLIIVSNYQKHMKVWLDHFSLKQILFLDSVTFVKDPVEELNKVEDFLGIKRFFTQTNFVFNATRGMYCQALQDGKVKCQKKKKGMPHPDIEKGLNNKLKKFFRPRNQMFFKMINRTFYWDY